MRLSLDHKFFRATTVFLYALYITEYMVSAKQISNNNKSNQGLAPLTNTAQLLKFEYPDKLFISYSYRGINVMRKFTKDIE